MLGAASAAGKVAGRSGTLNVSARVVKVFFFSFEEDEGKVASG